jgi:hypothetical protein
MNLLRRLFPTDDEIYRLGQAETDPRRCAEFTPVTLGPAFAVAALLLVGFVAVIVTPFWVLRRRA